MNSTDRKVVLITGASAGIGAALAREVARQGRNLALTARRGDRLESLARELRPLGIDVLAVPADLEDQKAPEAIVGRTVEHFGGIDVLINYAGFGLPMVFAEADPLDLRRQLEVNFVAPLLLAREAIPHLIARKGTIINIGSAITSVANSALGAYGATKAGLAYWNDALRRELRHRGVKVCLVEPGPVKTEFFDALMTFAPAGGQYNPLLDAPLPWMTADVTDVACRIARLIDRPVRRLSVRRRVVWPFRMMGGLFRVWPWLGDVALSSVIYHFDRAGDLKRARNARSLGDARPTD
ncbi:MAG: SDR family NAD(P)-dependent oxidoreductase [Isosphaeraceae bacterium]|nr:SDR family NAD(P)-dependent oxidoreductase [Isosphaeraceae bacterium]